jgi:hypothetical protein
MADHTDAGPLFAAVHESAPGTSRHFAAQRNLDAIGA